MPRGKPFSLAPAPRLRAGGSARFIAASKAKRKLSVEPRSDLPSVEADPVVLRRARAS